MVTFFERTGICAGCAGRTESVKTCTSPPPPEVATTITGLLKVAQGEWKRYLQPSGGSPSSNLNTQASLGLTSQGKSSQRLGVKAKRQLTRKYNLPKTCIAHRSVDLDPQTDKLQ